MQFVCHELGSSCPRLGADVRDAWGGREPLLGSRRPHAHRLARPGPLRRVSRFRAGPQRRSEPASPGLGSTPVGRLRAGLKRHLDAWEQVRISIRWRRGGARGGPRHDALAGRSSGDGRGAADRSRRRAHEEELGLPGLSVESAKLCRDKPAMKAGTARRRNPLRRVRGGRLDGGARGLRRARRLPAGAQAARRPRLASRRFASTTAPSSMRAASRLGVARGESAAVEEFIEGHEGFYDTLSDRRRAAASSSSRTTTRAFSKRCRTVASRRRSRRRTVSSCASYDELREVGRKVIRALGIGTSATHMEWFFGPKGLKVSEIGARPPGERIWDLYCVGNDLDLYADVGERHRAPVGSKTSRAGASRPARCRCARSATGKIVGYEGLDDVLAGACGDAIFAHEIPPLGSETVPISKGLPRQRLVPPAAPRLRRAAREHELDRPDASRAGRLTTAGSGPLRSDGGDQPVRRSTWGESTGASLLRTSPKAAPKISQR